MYRRHGNKLGLVFLACDLSVTAATWVAAYLLRFSLLPSPGGVPDLDSVLSGLPLICLLAAVSYRLCGLYEVHRLKQLPRELGVVVQASGLLFVLAITLTFYRRHAYESRLALGLFFLLNVVALTVMRRQLWRGLKFFRSRGLNHGRAVIVGSGRHGQRVARTIQNNSWTGLEPVGFVDCPDGPEPALLPRLGSLDELPAIVEKHRIDHVFVALPLSRYGELPKVYRAVSDVLAEVQLVPDIPSITGARLRMLEIDRVPFLSLRENPQEGWGRWAKRLMDLALGSAALVMAAPVMLALTAAIKLTSRGPVLYRQRRTGLGGRDFQMFKFRSMRVDAEAETGPVWARPDDGRCTSVGRFMRRWSLDELPQLFNVLAGDMSLVGPRPERDVFVERFRQQLPGYAQRHWVKAGMTGWAQVNGWRGNTSVRHRLRCDLDYIANWSLALDLKILLMTIWRGFRHKNAY
ncbi:MAG TPA: undecaprenyl-phosphate glucose phosphotransferase [Planctomycetaceae bacterium]|nr:undecaprenyl-phosphate glucose phosphotransferase [Planctomycetaceae bacterium]HIQ21729.1 undecaprenyl-phosphate glucose phosphotransferase [Planctomycetota bacterium]